jgi:hypothetical protein
MNRTRNALRCAGGAAVAASLVSLLWSHVAVGQSRPLTGGFGAGGSGAGAGFGGSAPASTPRADAAVASVRDASAMIQVFPVSGAREEIVGYDATLQAVTYVERTPSAVGGFSHAALVTVNARGERTRVALTTNVDEDRLRTTRDSRIFREIDARIVRSVTEARARLGGGGSILPAAEVNAAQGGVRCVNAPYAAREFSVGDLGVVRLAPAADERSTRIQITRAGRSGPAVDAPAVSVIEPRTSRALFVPYNRVADARELPGTDKLALLLRSDACTPEGVSPIVSAVLVEPPGDQALTPLEHAELTDVEAMRILAPRARRRTVDEVSGFFERGGARVVYDNAWRIAGSYDLLLVQFSRHDRNLSPTIAMSGHAPAHYALVRTGGRRPELLFQFAPSLSQAFEGVGQEAFSADLDGDGRAEAIIRVRAQDGSEYITVLRVSDSDLNFAWAGEVGIDGRRGGASQCCANNVVRRCSVGLDNRALVLRCRHETYSGVGPDARLLSSRVRIERLRYNGGSAALEVMER